MDWGRFREASDTLLQIRSRSGAGDVAELDAALACFAAGRNAEAATILREIVARTPMAWRALFELGRVLQSAEQLEEAEACYMAALNLGADDIYCLMNSGICRLAQGDPARAEAIFRQCLEREPDNARCWLNLGVALWTQGRDAEALGAQSRSDSLRGRRRRGRGPCAICPLLDRGRSRVGGKGHARTRTSPQARSHGRTSCWASLHCAAATFRKVGSNSLSGGWWTRWPRQEQGFAFPNGVARIRAARVILVRLEGGYGDNIPVHSLRARFEVARRDGDPAITGSALRGIDHRFEGVDRDCERIRADPRSSTTGSI